MTKLIMIVIAAALVAACAHTAPSQAPTMPRPRPVPEREINALANEALTISRGRGFDALALGQALGEENAVDVCRALGLTTTQCEEWGARANDVGRRLHEADGHVREDASMPPRRCSDDFRPCCQAALTAAFLTGRSAAIIAGVTVVGILRCACRHCPGRVPGSVCASLP